MKHKPVLLSEAIELLNIKKGDVVVDATLGSGGHAREILKRIGKNGRLIGIDLDINAINDFKKSLPVTNYSLVNDNFANIENILKNLGIDKVDAILADLGWRIEQVEDSQYGMSFNKDAPLNMNLSQMDRNGITAVEIINEWPEEELVSIFKQYGEEKHAKLAARAICDRRKEERIETTKQLVGIIEKSIGFKYKKSKINSATRIFQALRIAVNDELGNLGKFLESSSEVLRKNGRIAVISFHSLEDRMVKEFFRTNAGGCVCPKELPICVCGKKPKLEIVTRKPVKPSQGELGENPRSRSAKLRVAELINSEF